MTTIFEKIDYKLKKIEKTIYEKGKKDGIEEVNHKTIIERYRGKSFGEKVVIIFKILIS